MKLAFERRQQTLNLALRVACGLTTIPPPIVSMRQAASTFSAERLFNSHFRHVALRRSWM
jgi:hypothetical protein